MSRQQAVLVLSAGAWKPMQGIHRGVVCAECGDSTPTMYALQNRIEGIPGSRIASLELVFFCETHKPTIPPTTEAA